jgi:hypothetical protein
MIRSLVLRRRSAAAVLALCVAACGGDKSPTGTDNPSGQNVVTFSGSALSITVAATCASRSQGLMGVNSLGANSGMLFAFSDDRQRYFWMKDTPIPLSIVFLDANKKVVYMADMAANTTNAYPPGLNGPQMRYAVEANQGWFASHGVSMGSTATFTLPTSLAIEPDCP